jgi:hypothetical protein
MTLRVMPQPLKPALANPRFGIAPNLAAARNGATIPFALTLVLLGLFLPIELSFYVLGLRFTVIRLVFLMLTPVLLVRLAQKVSAGRYRFILSDLFVVLTGFWLIYAPANVDGLAPALNHAGPDVLEFCIGYMTTRTLLSKHGQAISFVDLLCRIIAVVALLGLLDPLTGHHFIHELAAQLTGSQVTLENWHDAYRLGLLRATGPIEHPILYAFTCAIGLLIAVSTPIRWRRFVIFSCGSGVFFGLSSAPVFALFLGFGLIVYNRVMSRAPLHWLILIGGGAVVITAVFLLSSNPIGFVVSNLIYSPDSGYYREWTWDRVIFYVSQSPWYGLGFGVPPDDINHSIDSLWLVLARYYGFPGAVLVALSLIGAASLPTSGRNINLLPAESKLGTTLGILIFLTIYMGFTVHLWGTSWILAGLLIGVKAHLGELGHVRSVQRRMSFESAENPAVRSALR